MKKLLLLSLLSSLGFAQTTEEVWQHHIDAWKARNLSAIMADYSEESVVLMGTKVYRGKKEIEGLFQNLFATFDKAEHHQIDPVTVIEKVVYFTWNARIQGKAYPLGTDTFFIDKGTIEYQTITTAPDLF